MNKVWLPKAWDDYVDFQGDDRKTLRRINSLIKSISRNGYKAIGKIEPLKHDRQGRWSARIDDKNRLVFRIANSALEIWECGTHYGDK